MTEKRLLEDPVLQDLGSGNNNAKEILNKAKPKLLFQNRITRSVQKFDSYSLFFATTTAGFKGDVAALINLPPDMEDEVLNEDGSVHLVCTGAATSKRRAEMLAAVDTILFLEELGIDARNPPDYKAILRARKEEAAKDL